MKAVNGQTAVDLTIQEYGTLERLMDFAQENGIEPDKHYVSGEEYIGGQPNETTRYFDKKGILIVNGEQTPSKYPGQAYSDDYGTDYG